MASKPIAVPGLVNYGKLQSTRGQMHAFSHDPAAAVPCFEAAATNFARLSDPRQVARETHQTGIYEMIARMDAVPFGANGEEASVQAGAVLDTIRQLLGNRDSNANATPGLKPGGRLLREWNGTTHTVEVTEAGYRWNRTKYPSLSAVARAITGARWSGPRFFGLKEAG